MTAVFDYNTANLALTAPSVAPLRIPGWECEPYEIQTRGITWLYAIPRAILADVTGTGKTIHGIGLTALLKAKGELRRAIFVVKSGTVGQWVEQFERFLPSATVMGVQDLNRAERMSLYRYGWDVLVLPYDTMWRDVNVLAGLCPTLVFFDESTSFKNRETRTAEGARKLVANAERVVCASATPIQNQLQDLYSQLEVLGLAGRPNSLFGTPEMFEARYLEQQMEQVRVKGGRFITRKRVVAYLNFEELVAKLTPYYLRRTEGSGDMPDVVPEDISVPMLPAQAAFYREVQQSDDYDPAAKATYLLETCSTPANLGAPDDSAKLDWLMRFLEENPSEKVVVFARWLGTISAAARRMQAAHIGYRVISGSQTGSERDIARRDFWEDPECRVMLITSAGEMGLNLQCARYVVCLDLMWNPARMEQILGRVKRSGSQFSHVFMLRLIAPGSIEENVLSLLRRKQALADAVNGDTSDLFKQLSEEEMRLLIRGPRVEAAA